MDFGNFHGKCGDSQFWDDVSQTCTSCYTVCNPALDLDPEKHCGEVCPGFKQQNLPMKAPITRTTPMNHVTTNRTLPILFIMFSILIILVVLLGALLLWSRTSKNKNATKGLNTLEKGKKQKRNTNKHYDKSQATQVPHSNNPPALNQVNTVIIDELKKEENSINTSNTFTSATESEGNRLTECENLLHHEDEQSQSKVSSRASSHPLGTVNSKENIGSPEVVAVAAQQSNTKAVTAAEEITTTNNEPLQYSFEHLYAGVPKAFSDEQTSDTNEVKNQSGGDNKEEDWLNVNIKEQYQHDETALLTLQEVIEPAQKADIQHNETEDTNLKAPTMCKVTMEQETTPLVATGDTIVKGQHMITEEDTTVKLHQPPPKKPKERPNKKIYDILKRTGWVQAYYSEGKSIEVYVDPEEISFNHALSELVKNTGEKRDKFKMKENGA